MNTTIFAAISVIGGLVIGVALYSQLYYHDKFTQKTKVLVSVVVGAVIWPIVFGIFSALTGLR